MLRKCNNSYRFYFTHIWKAPTWPHYFTKGMFGPIKLVKPLYNLLKCQYQEMNESDSSIGVLIVSILPLFKILIFDLELFRQCGIFFSPFYCTESCSLCKWFTFNFNVSCFSTSLIKIRCLFTPLFIFILSWKTNIKQHTIIGNVNSSYFQLPNLKPWLSFGIILYMKIITLKIR